MEFDEDDENLKVDPALLETCPSGLYAIPEGPEIVMVVDLLLL